MKTLRIPAILVIILFAFGCEKSFESSEEVKRIGTVQLEFNGQPILPNSSEPISYLELNALLIQDYEEDQQMKWEELSDYEFWSAVVNSQERLIAIGYKPMGWENDISEIIHEIDINKPEWQDAKNAILEFIQEELSSIQGKEVSIESFLNEDDALLPHFVVEVSNYELIAKLRRCNLVRFVEPLDYDPLRSGERSSAFGCGGSGGISNADYINTSPNVKIPWNFYNMNIPTAWSYASGDGITVGVIDAGYSTSQPGLNSGFSTGQSTGRSSFFTHTYGSSPYNTCVHGTSMAGLATAPRNSSGNMVGVAYKADLIGVRACEDVMLNRSGERKAVKNALKYLGNNSNVRVISMSIGWIFGSSYLKDGTDYAYNKGKLIFAAGGTSFSATTWWGVIYPAKYSKVAAVTGVNEGNSKCSNCHWGSSIEFTAVMERSSNSSRKSISLGVSGNSPIYMGGSSAATATSAGIAALVWSANPSLSRDQVRNILRQTAQYYPNKNGNRGYGLMNATAAVQQAIATP